MSQWSSFTKSLIEKMSIHREFIFKHILFVSVLYMSTSFSRYKPLKFLNCFYPVVFFRGVHCIYTNVSTSVRNSSDISNNFTKFVTFQCTEFIRNLEVVFKYRERSKRKKKTLFKNSKELAIFISPWLRAFLLQWKVLLLRYNL